MKKILLICVLFGSLNICAQQVWLLDMKFLTRDQEPISSTFVDLNSEKNEYSCAFTDEEGVGRFVIDSLPSNLDSLFLLIDGDKINFNNLSLLKKYTDDNYIIHIIYLRYFLNEEFDKYRKEKNLMPLRSKD